MKTLTGICIALFAVSLIAAEAPVSPPFYTGAPWNQDHPQAASDGTNFLIAWRDNRAGTGLETIFAARVGADGQLLDTPTALPDPRPAQQNGGTNAAPVVVWTGSVYVVAWQDWPSKTMRLVRVDRDGHVLDAAPQSIPNVWAIQPGAAASTGDAALIAYTGADLPNPFARAVLLDDAGSIVKMDVVLPTGRADDQPVAASNGASFYVAWRRWDGTQSFVMGATVSRDGTVGDARTLAATWSGPAIASNGGDYLVVYIDANKGAAVQRVDASGNTVSQHSLDVKLAWPFAGNVVAPYGSGYVVASNDDQRHVSGAVLDRDGQHVRDIVLATLGVADGAVALAASPNATIAVWPEDRFGGTISTDIFSRILDVQAADTLVTRAAARQRYPRIALGSGGGLAVWLEYRGADDAELRAARFSNGEDSIKIADHVVDPPAVVFDGLNYIVGWIDRQSAQPGVYFARISSDGTLRDTRLLAAGEVTSFALASDGRESLVCWDSHDRDFTPHLNVTRIARDGSIDSFVELPNNNHDATDLAAASSNDAWLVAWTEIVPIPDPCGVCGRPPRPPVYNVIGARLTSAFNLLDVMPIAIAAKDDVNEQHPSVASNGADFLVAWDQQWPMSPTVYARTISPVGIMGDAIPIATGSFSSIAWQDSDFAIGWEYGGNLWYSHLQNRTTFPLATSADDESDVTLAASGNMLIAAYERTASEQIYGGVTRAFLKTDIQETTMRTRSVRR